MLIQNAEDKTEAELSNEFSFNSTSIEKNNFVEETFSHQNNIPKINSIYSDVKRGTRN